MTLRPKEWKVETVAPFRSSGRLSLISSAGLPVECQGQDATELGVAVGGCMRGVSLVLLRRLRDGARCTTRRDLLCRPMG